MEHKEQSGRSDHHSKLAGIVAALVSTFDDKDRFNPVGKVWKYFNGAWQEAGKGGRVTPIFPVMRVLLP